VELKGRGCRERMDRPLDRYKVENAKVSNRSGTEELNQVSQDILAFRRDTAELKRKENQDKKKEEE